jgi:hypothetical protein
VNYIIAMTPRSRRIIAHVDKLKLWHGDASKCWDAVDPSAEAAPSRNTVGTKEHLSQHDTDRDDASGGESDDEPVDIASKIPVLVDAAAVMNAAANSTSKLPARPSKIPIISHPVGQKPVMENNSTPVSTEYETCKAGSLSATYGSRPVIGIKVPRTAADVGEGPGINISSPTTVRL